MKGSIPTRHAHCASCTQTCVVVLLAIVVVIPLAVALSIPLARYYISPAPSTAAATAPPARRVSISTLRKGGFVSAPKNQLQQYAMRPAWPAADAGVFGALDGEDFRLETVSIDVGKMRHYISLCDASLPAEFHLGGLAAFAREPRVAFRAPHPEAPVTCAAASFFMVNTRDRTKGDDLLDYLLETEHDGIELWVGLLSADRCRAVARAAGGRPHACRANFPTALKGRSPIVLDIGSNSGFYALLAARLGYKTIAVDPQPHCVQHVRIASAASGVTDRLTVLNAFVSETGALPDGSTNVAVPLRSGCWGTFPVPSGNAEYVKEHFSRFPGGNASALVPVINPNTLIGDKEIAVLMKLDTEGAEIGILRALAPSLASGKILNFMIEFNKGVIDAHGKVTFPTAREGVILEALVLLTGYGYTVFCAQYGNPGGFDYTPGMSTREELAVFVADGWRTVNLWAARNFESLPESG